MTWVLIVIFWSSGYSTAITTAEFRTEAGCIAAGKAIKQKEPTFKFIEFTCNKNM